MLEGYFLVSCIYPVSHWRNSGIYDLTAFTSYLPGGSEEKMHNARDS